VIKTKYSLWMIPKYVPQNQDVERLLSWKNGKMLYQQPFDQFCWNFA